MREGVGTGAGIGGERLRSLYAATRDLVAATSREELAELAVDAAEDTLDVPFAAVYLRASASGDGPRTTDPEVDTPTDGGAGRDIRSDAGACVDIGGDSNGNGDGTVAVGAESRPAAEGERLTPAAYTGGVRERVGGPPPAFGPDDRMYEAFRTGEPLELLGGSELLPGGFAGVVIPLGDHGVFLVGVGDASRAWRVPVGLAELLAGNTAVALDRVRRERRLNGLHETTRELMEARDTAEVAAAATNTAHEVLGLRVNAVYLRSSDGSRLSPVSVTAEARELFGEVPELVPGSVAWQVYESGRPVRHDDVGGPGGVADAGTPVRSELVLPLGDHGVFLAGSERPRAFDDGDLALARVFADNVEAALDRAERETERRRRERELARQNERLDDFASVISHDLRNPLNVAEGHVELLGDECDSEHLERIEEAHERMETLVGDILALARHGRSVGDTESVALGPLARSAWDSVEGGAELVVHADLGEVDADRSRLRELFSNLFRNAVEHAGPDVGVEVGPLADGAGFFVADDGPGVPEDERDRVFEQGFTTAETGTGFGLAIVEEVAEAHGWAVRLADDADESASATGHGGARFTVHTDECPRTDRR